MLRPQDLRRARDLAPTIAVLFVVRTVDLQASAIILDHAMHGLRIMNCCTKILEVAIAHLFRGPAIPSKWIGQDSALRFVLLGEEKPVPPRLGKFLVASLQRLQDRNAIKDAERLDCLRLFHGSAKSCVAPPIMSR